jgi:hypothetical protein
MLVFLFANYMKGFTALNWSEYWFKNKGWIELFKDPSAHKGPFISFLIFCGVCIIAITVNFKKKD